jgi:HPt (histidine-containing phosphotransfer) domain-containing protein
MDCQMPVMDGYAATREIRRDPVFKDLPVIAMTANAMAGDKEKVLEAGMWDHIAKPLDMADMFATMAKWIVPATAPAITADNTKPKSPHAGEPMATGFLTALHLPGIDTRSGLAIALNRESLYQRFLLKFRDSQANFADRFIQARLGSDGSAAQRCAHTLNGSAANVGATRVQDAAHRLEQGCKLQAPDTQIDELLADVMTELLPVLEALKELGNEDSAVATQSSNTVEMESLAGIRERMLELLGQGDSRAIRLCDERRDLWCAAYPSQWSQIADCIHSFDFEAAQALMQEAGSNEGKVAKVVA